jgi:hypothetical protein
MYVQAVQLKSSCITLGCDRPQHDRPATCVIAQQYSNGPIPHRAFKKYYYLFLFPFFFNIKIA